MGARERLTQRENEVARAFSEGATYKEIARQLELSPATVRTHLHRVYEKLKVSSKIELAREFSGKPHTDTATRKRTLAIARAGLPRLAVRKFSVSTSDVAEEGLQTELLVRINQRFSSNAWMSVHSSDDTDFAEFTLDGNATGSQGLLSINALLLDNHDQQIVWSGRRQGAPHEFPTLVDQLSHEVAGVLTGLWPGVPSGRKRAYATTPPSSLSAYEHYSLGIERLYQTTPRSYAEAAQAMRQSLEIEPRFVPALVGLSISLSWQGLASNSVEQLASIEDERIAAIEKARSISPNDPPVLVETAWLLARLGKNIAATNLLLEAVERTPHSADLLAYAALRGAFWSDSAQRPIDWISSALLTNQTPPSWYDFARGFTQLAAGNAESALPFLNRTRDAITRGLYGATALRQLGKTRDALAVISDLGVRAPYFDLDLHLRAMGAEASQLGDEVRATYEDLVVRRSKILSGR